LPEGIKVNVAQALLPVGLSRNCQSGLERSDIQGQHGGEAQFAEPPASRQNTALLDRSRQSGLERSDIQGQHGGETQFAEPPASGQTTFQDIEAAKAVWSVAT
jgi:hypothetical protein